MNNWSLNKKFALILSIFSLSVLVTLGYGIKKLRIISADFNTVTDVKLKEVTLLHKLRFSRLQLNLAEKNMILSTDPGEIQGFAKDLGGHAAKYLEALGQLESSAPESDKSKLVEIKSLFAEILKNEQTLKGLALANNTKEAFQLSTGPLAALGKKLGGITTEMLEAQDKSMNELANQSVVTVRETTVFLTALGFISLITGLGFAFFILRATNRSIRRVVDLLGETSDHVAEASQQIAASSSELSGSTTEQAAALQETTASVEELSGMTLKNTESANQTASLSTASQKTAERGQTIITEMLAAVQEIDQSNKEIMAQTKDSNQQFADIVKIISEIGSKTKVINDIVFQTKLLSFNASVEAARAGEHGKGFAVVAEEVGNLAQMSGNAAKEISTMLDGSISKVNMIVSDNQAKLERLLSLGKEKVEAGAHIARQCETVLTEIRGSAAEVNEMAASIAGASKEQSQGISEINKAMSQLDQVTQQNSTVTTEVATAAEALAAQAIGLKSVVSDLCLAVLGAQARSGSSQTLSRQATKPNMSLVENAGHSGSDLRNAS